MRIEITGSQVEKRAFIRRIMKSLQQAEVGYSLSYGAGKNPDVIEPHTGAALDRFLSEEVR